MLYLWFKSEGKRHSKCTAQMQCCHFPSLDYLCLFIAQCCDVVFNVIDTYTDFMTLM